MNKEKLRELRLEAIKREKINASEMMQKGLTEQSQKIIADRQYWNGYLDALNTVEKEILNKGQ